MTASSCRTRSAQYLAIVVGSLLVCRSAASDAEGGRNDKDRVPIGLPMLKFSRGAFAHSSSSSWLSSSSTYESAPLATERHLMGLQGALDDDLVDGLIGDDAFFSNATFAEWCPSRLQSFFAAYYECQCGSNSSALSSITCVSTDEPVPVEGAPNLKAVLNTTITYRYAPNETAFNETAYSSPVDDDSFRYQWGATAGIQVCFDYRYYQVPKSTKAPPDGCINLAISDDGTALDGCSATLTDANQTVRNCSSCRVCSSSRTTAAIQVDCSNVNPLAISDGCYSLSGNETMGIFRELLQNVGSGAIAPSNGVGRTVTLMLLAHAAAMVYQAYS